jgi:hypothetical protein
MKRLLWMMSISCFLPAVIAMPSQASSLEAQSVKSISNKVATASLDDQAVSNQAVEDLTASNSIEMGIVQPLVIASKPQTSLDTIANPEELQASADLNNLVISQAPPAPTEAPPPSPTVPGTPVAPTEVPAPSQIAPGTPIAPAETPAPSSSTGELPSTAELDGQLNGLSTKQFPANLPGSSGGSSPGLAINNPTGFGADNWTAFLSGSYQSRTRFTQTSDGELGVGIGLGDAVNAVGLEVAYTLDSFGTSNGFGTGAFSAKLHKRIADDTAVAIGWNQFARVQVGSGSGPDFPRNSYYAVGTQVIRTSANIDDFLSRIALSVGVGGGQFLSQETLNAAAAVPESPSGVNVFGSAAFRIAKPISAVVEWTGQDLAAGLSIVPFGDAFPLVISPSFRDISGAGDGARFVLGVGTAFKF